MTGIEKVLAAYSGIRRGDCGLCAAVVNENFGQIITHMLSGCSTVAGKCGW